MDKKCRRVFSELISFCMQSGEKLMFFRNKDIVNLSDLYSIYKRMGNYSEPPHKDLIGLT